MANLPMEGRMGLPRKILAVPRRILQHHSRTIRQGRDHQRTIRTDDARPTTTQLRPINPQMGFSSFSSSSMSNSQSILLCPEIEIRSAKGLMHTVEIKSTENGPNLVHLDGEVLT